ncbi:MAG: sulfatase activating formylglycine-generating enzyme [Gammaproteobacteria bacterium]
MNRREHETGSEKELSQIITPTAFRPPGTSVDLPRMKLPWAQGLIAAILITGLWAAWYVITARSVKVVVNPSQALVTFDELIAPSIDDHWVLRPGKRQIVVEAPGYKTYRGALLITDELIQTHAVSLNPLPGHLRVEITPVDSATITIDELITATVPSTVSNIDAGPRQIEISADRYLTFSTVLEIEGRGIEQHLKVNLRPAWATVSIETSPIGATVAVDDKPLEGATPLASELLQGQRMLEVSLDGYKPWRRSIQVTAGVPIDLPPILLDKADGYIDLVSTPAGASVTLDSKFQGQSPIKFPVSADAKHKISVRKEGYGSQSKSITVAAGEIESVSLRLEAELAAVQILATPADAELLVDGQSRGPASQTLKLATHAHQIEVRKPGFVSYESTVTPRVGIKKQIKVRLKRLSKASSAVAQRSPAGRVDTNIITSFVGQKLRLFRGGDITMGSSRRDPNRRANEILRKATLVRPFYFGVHEVANGEFRRFLANHHVAPISGINVDGDTNPVINVSWESAALFCNWLSRKDSLDVFYQIKNGKVLGINPAALGYRLPTEAEWAWVARSAPKSTDFFKYPWAGKFPPRGRSGNYADQSADSILGQVLADYNDGFPATAPVGSYPASLRGIRDMGGNVSEWMNDYYAAATDPSIGRQPNPLGPRTGTARVIRGSNWSHASPTELRFAYRDFGNDGRDDVGFRIARYAR